MFKSMDRITLPYLAYTSERMFAMPLVELFLLSVFVGYNTIIGIESKFYGIMCR